MTTNQKNEPKNPKGLNNNEINSANENLEIKDDAAIVLDAKDVESLKKQGIDENDLQELMEAVHEELSDNANLKEEIKEEVNAKKNDHKNDQSSISAKDESADISLNKDLAKAKNNNNEEFVKNSNDETEDATTIEQNAEIVKSFIAKKHSEKTINHKEVRIAIESGALPTKMFYVMNGLAAVIASYGLLANSPAIVIGAMLVAMMLGPITGTALAVIDARFALLKKSLGTMLTGVLLIYAIGLTLGFLHPDSRMTDEIMSRTSPNTMDLMVALAGGAAGAYAMISPNLSVAVVGVAVATALVPPLAASAILLSGGHWQLAMGAFLLTVTNIIAIQFTNALVLWFAGFRRGGDDLGLSGVAFIKRNLVALVILVVLGGYLTINFRHSINQQRFERGVARLIDDSIKNQQNYLVSSSFGNEDKKYIVRAVVQGLTTPTREQVAALEREIQALSDKYFKNRAPVALQIRFVPEIVIESQPIQEGDVKLNPYQINNLDTTNADKK